MRYLLLFITTLTLTFGIISLLDKPETKPFKCSHEYSYFKSEEAFVITQAPALNECEE